LNCASRYCANNGVVSNDKAVIFSKVFMTIVDLLIC
jgi:hypothetical protein